MMKIRPRLLVGAAIASALLVQTSISLADPGANVPSIWAPYDMIINLDHLPKQYSCMDLWYKFRDVLWAVGARRITEILPYDCGSGRADQGRSPKVHVVFALVEAASGIQARYANMRASSAEIRLEPGRPITLDNSDCRLLQQMNDTLFRSLPLHVANATWNCDAPVAGPRYGLTLQVLNPVTQGTHKTTADGGARSSPGVS